MMKQWAWMILFLLPACMDQGFESYVPNLSAQPDLGLSDLGKCHKDKETCYSICEDSFAIYEALSKDELFNAIDICKTGADFYFEDWDRITAKRMLRYACEMEEHLHQEDLNCEEIYHIWR
jgi:hypothetical protein